MPWNEKATSPNSFRQIYNEPRPQDEQKSVAKPRDLRILGQDCGSAKHGAIRLAS